MAIMGMPAQIKTDNASDDFGAAPHQGEEWSQNKFPATGAWRAPESFRT